MNKLKRIEVRPEASTIWVRGLGDTKRMQAAAILYEALRDWLEHRRLVDVGLLPSGVLRLAYVGDRTTLAVRGVPIGRLTPDTLELFLPPYVRGTTALDAAVEVAKVLRKNGLAERAIVDTGEDHGQHVA